MAKAAKKRREPASKPKQKVKILSLRKLVAKITPENRYREISTGYEVGKEVTDW